MMIYADYHDRLNDMFKFGWEWLDAPLFSSLLVMLVLLILGIVIGIKAHKAARKGQYKEHQEACSSGQMLIMTM